MLDDATVLLRRAGQEARHVDKRQERDVEAIAEAHEASGLYRGVDVQAAGQVCGLIGDDPDGPSAEPTEADYDVGGECRLNLEEVLVVEDGADHREHVI